MHRPWEPSGSGRQRLSGILVLEVEHLALAYLLLDLRAGVDDRPNAIIHRKLILPVFNALVRPPHHRTTAHAHVPGSNVPFP